MAEEEQQQQQVKAARQEGKMSATVAGATADQVWPLIADFGNIHHWLPFVNTCRLESGVVVQQGCIRYCDSKIKCEPDVDGGDMLWARERLNGIDHTTRKLSYAVIENNMGWKYYEAEMEVVEKEEGGEGCTVWWSFKMEPIAEGNGVEVLPFVTTALEMMVKSMEEFLAGGSGVGSDGDGGNSQELVDTVMA